MLQGVNNDLCALQLGGSLAYVYTEAYSMYAHDQVFTKYSIAVYNTECKGCGLLELKKSII